MYAVQLGVGPTARVILLKGAVIRIGRAHDCDLCLPEEPTVSRRHVELRLAADRWCVEDLGSSNGTYVNGLRINQRTALRAGDRIGLGPSAVLELIEVHPEDHERTLQASPTPARLPLSPREREVLIQLCQGRTDAEIAARLSISPRTVHTHLNRIRDKTGRRTRAELAVLGADLHSP